MSMNHSMNSKNNSLIFDNLKTKYRLQLDLVQNSFQKKFKRINSAQYLIKSFKNIKNNNIINQEKSNNNIINNNNSNRNIIINGKPLTINNNQANINENIDKRSSSRTSSNIIINTSYYQVFNGNIQTFNQNNITNNNYLNINIKKINKCEINNIENKSNNINKNYENNKYKKCFLCEKTYKKEFLFYSECNMHGFCKDCLNAYYGQIIEKENPNLECPVYKCNFKINLENFKNLLDDKYYNELNKVQTYNKNKKNNLKSKSLQNSLIYSQNNILEINSNNQLKRSIKDLKAICPMCKMPIYKTKAHFYKCLNCNYKACKYCFKEYTQTHLIMNEKDYCKVYARSSKENKINYFKIFLKQLLFVIAIFILCILGCFILPFRSIKNKFKFDDKKNNYFCINLFLSFIFSIISIIIAIPFIIIFIILFPFFPYFIAFLDF